MKHPLPEMLKHLAVPKTLGAYETYPWLMYDEDQEISCSAEVRMGAGADALEAELQFMYDDPHKAPGHNPQQVMLMRIENAMDGVWAPKALIVKGDKLSDTLGGWEEKGCKFFTACVQSIMRDELPDIDSLISKELKEDDSGSGRRGRIGRKSPKVNQQALLGMKK